MSGSGEGVVSSGNRLLYDEKILIWMAFIAAFLKEKQDKEKIRSG